jgi:hypothetical protein
MKLAHGLRECLSAMHTQMRMCGREWRAFNHKNHAAPAPKGSAMELPNETAPQILLVKLVCPSTHPTMHI